MFALHALAHTWKDSSRDVLRRNGRRGGSAILLLLLLVQCATAKKLLLHDFKRGPTPIPQWIADHRSFWKPPPLTAWQSI